MTKNGQLQNGLSDFSATRKVSCACLTTNPSNKRLRCQGSDLQATPKPASNEQLRDKELAHEFARHLQRPLAN